MAVRNAICVPDRRDAGEDTAHIPVRRSVEPRKVRRQRRGSRPRPLPDELRPMLSNCSIHGTCSPQSYSVCNVAATGRQDALRASDFVTLGGA